MAQFGGGVQAFTIYDTLDGSAFQISGKDIDPASTVTKTKVTRDSASGGIQKVVTESELELRFADGTVFGNLQNEDSQVRKWNAVAAGLNGRNLQWYEDETFVIEETSLFDPASTEYPYTLRMRNVSSSPSIHMNQNLLAYLGWEDSNSDGLADGYNIVNFDSSTFSADTQTIEETGVDTAMSMTTDIIFPVSGFDLTLSVNQTSLYSGAGTNAIYISSRQFNDSVVQFNEENHSSTGVASMTSSVPSNTYKFKVAIMVVRSIASTGSKSCKFPALTTNGKLTSGTEFMNF
jgi:hypothetical protein